MPFCPISSDNPLKARSDLMCAFSQLLDPLLPYYSEGRARLKLGTSGYHYTDRGAWLEGFSRVLWGLAPFAAGGGHHPALQLSLEGLRNGPNPAHPEYWGTLGDCDQRFVEMAAISYSILLAPKHFWDPLSAQEKENLCRWLSQINRTPIVKNNWYFFRVLVDLAFERVGWEYDRAVLEETLRFLDSLYREDGWFQDGENAKFDYYNSFAFHFYSMIYCRERRDRDPARCARYEEYAKLFARQFAGWFSSSGSSFPFGRSQTYRFGQASSFVGAALAGLPVLPWGEMKRIVLSHLRDWLQKPIFERDGVLGIGYGYSDLIMSENYNAPGSPYWALKLMGILALDESHPFWASEEARPARENQVIVQKVPGFLVQRLEGGEHVVALSGRQGSASGYYHSTLAAKYAKFAYSSRYGFSVSRGLSTLQEGAFDSMLALREPGEPFYRMRTGQALVAIDACHIQSRWNPWPDVTVDTFLIPAAGGHLRCHRVDTPRALETAEGGFCLRQTHDDGCGQKDNPLKAGSGSAYAEDEQSFSWIAELTGAAGERQGACIIPEANTSLIFPQSILPTLCGILQPGVHWLCCGVYAGKKEEKPLSLPALHICAGCIEVEEGGEKRRIDIL